MTQFVPSSPDLLAAVARVLDEEALRPGLLHDGVVAPGSGRPPAGGQVLFLRHVETPTSPRTRARLAAAKPTATGGVQISCPPPEYSVPDPMIFRPQGYIYHGGL